MTRILERLRALTVRQRMIAGAGTLATLVVLGTMVRMAMAPEMALLYAGLDPAAAGEVIAALDAEQVDYDVRGGSIYVEDGQRDRLRLSLAGQSLPSPSTEGYELLDRLDGFSTTSEMFDVTYWRAKEGELSRTLMTIPGIRAARVHIGAGERGAFARRNVRRTASVTVSAPAGLEDGQVRAIRFMTALAVPNLQASDVAVIDTARGLLTEDGESSEADARRVDALERDLLSLLEARVGIGDARVNVAMDVNRRREEIEERAVDPASAVVTSRRREEARSREEDTGGAVTVASDLPDGEPAAPGGGETRSEVREEVAYAVSTTDRRVELLPGAVERLSVAVLLNEPVGEDGSTVPRSPEEVEALRELVTAAAGIVPERGDVVTIRSLPFEKPLPLEEPARPGLAGLLPLGRLAELGVIGATALLFGLFVLRPMMKPASGGETLLISNRAGEGGDIFSAPEDPLLMLRQVSDQRPDAAATLLNAWLEEEEHA